MRGPRYAQARENVKKFRGAPPSHPEPRLRHAGPHRRPPGPAVGGRRVQRRDRRGERRQPDDGARVQGTRVPGHLRREPRPRDGTSGPPVRVVADDGQGQPAVSIGALRFEADAEEKRRDREETKRLLYVALTRARDRLYVATSLAPKGGSSPARAASLRCCPGPSSAVLAAAEEGRPPRSGRAALGASFPRCLAGRPLRSRRRPGGIAGTTSPTSWERAGRGGRARRPRCVTRSGRAGVTSASTRDWDVAGIGDALAGRLVHRLFQALDPSRARGRQGREPSRRRVTDVDRPRPRSRAKGCGPSRCRWSWTRNDGRARCGTVIEAAASTWGRCAVARTSSAVCRRRRQLRGSLLPPAGSPGERRRRRARRDRLPPHPPGWRDWSSSRLRRAGHCRGTTANWRSTSRLRRPCTRARGYGERS